MRNVDLNKPFVTDAIRAEFTKKDELLAAAKSTQTREDWAKYREQRTKCFEMYHKEEAAANKTTQNGQQEEVRITQLMPNSNFPRNSAPIDYTADVNF